MASTSNKNYPGNHDMQQKMNERMCDRATYIHSAPAEAYSNNLPGNGLLPAKLARNKLCSNYCDVESNLLGIGSTNLVTPQTPVVPEFNKVQSLNMMEKSQLFVPAPFIAKSHQRPSPLN
jgi:hypothetical protein|uniref:Uncharacterized protein n=1 Tax=viral metagenome TaxID=1070528 RepID=A0A6C0IM83_9ZZZZ